MARPGQGQWARTRNCAKLDAASPPGSTPRPRTPAPRQCADRRGPRLAADEQKGGKAEEVRPKPDAPGRDGHRARPPERADSNFIGKFRGAFGLDPALTHDLPRVAAMLRGVAPRRWSERSRPGRPRSSYVPRIRERWRARELHAQAADREGHVPALRNWSPGASAGTGGKPVFPLAALVPGRL